MSLSALTPSLPVCTQIRPRDPDAEHVMEFGEVRMTGRDEYYNYLRRCVVNTN